MKKYIPSITLEELTGKFAFQPTLNSQTKKQRYITHMSNLKVTPEMIERHKDRKERETGTFHWKDRDGTYLPIDKVSVEVLEHASITCQRKMCQLHEEMCGWQYRLDKIEEETAKRGVDLPYYEPEQRVPRKPKFKTENIKTMDIVEDPVKKPRPAKSVKATQ